MSNDAKNARLKRYTDKEIVAALRDSGGLVEIAARELGCNASTIYRRIEKSDKVRAAIASEREYSIDLAERNLRRALAAGDNGRRFRAALPRFKRYVEKQQVEHSGVEIILKWDEDESDDQPPKMRPRRRHRARYRARPSIGKTMLAPAN